MPKTISTDPSVLRGINEWLVTGCGNKAEVLIHVLLCSFERLTTEYIEYDTPFEQAIRNLMTTTADHLAEPQDFSHSQNMHQRKTLIDAVVEQTPAEYMVEMRGLLNSLDNELAKESGHAPNAGEFVPLVIQYLRMFSEAFK